MDPARGAAGGSNGDATPFCPNGLEHRAQVDDIGTRGAGWDSPSRFGTLRHFPGLGTGVVPIRNLAGSSGFCPDVPQGWGADRARALVGMPAGGIFLHAPVAFTPPWIDEVGAHGWSRRYLASRGR